MRLSETFEVATPLGEVWRLLEQPDAVASCVPGVEQLTVRTPDDIDVRISQSIGPMNATFAANVQVTEREPEKQIRFTAQGKTVRGAMGNVRAGVEVSLAATATGTEIRLDADVALAGALGSVGQKVVAKQAGKVIAQFADNIAVALGAPTAAAAAEPARTVRAAASSSAVRPGPRILPPVSEAPAGAPDPWSKVAALFGAVAAVAAVASLLRGRRSR